MRGGAVARCRGAAPQAPARPRPGLRRLKGLGQDEALDRGGGQIVIPHDQAPLEEECQVFHAVMA